MTNIWDKMNNPEIDIIDALMETLTKIEIEKKKERIMKEAASCGMNANRDAIL